MHQGRKEAVTPPILRVQEKGNQQEGQKPRGGVLEGSKEDSDNCLLRAGQGPASRRSPEESSVGVGVLIAGKSERVRGIRIWV